MFWVLIKLWWDLRDYLYVFIIYFFYLLIYIIYKIYNVVILDLFEILILGYIVVLLIKN